MNSVNPLILNHVPPCSKIVLVLGFVFWKIGRDNSVTGIRRDLLGRDGRTKVSTYDLDDEEDLVFSLNSEA